MKIQQMIQELENNCNDNTWPKIIKALVDVTKHCKLFKEDLFEPCIDWVEGNDDPIHYELRYNMSESNALDFLQKLKPFEKLREYEE